MADSTPVREALNLFQQSIQNVQKDAAEKGTSALVAVGHLCWNLNALTARLIEELKPVMRKAASPRKKEGAVLLKGAEDTFCTVTFPPPQLELDPKVDVEKLRESLGLQFGSFFEIETLVRPRRDIETQLVDPDLDVGVRSEVLQVLIQREQTPRVSFK